MNSLGVQQEAKPGLEDDERWQLAKRIAASPHFVRSVRLKEFLLYIAEKALTGQLGAITEHEIGCRVFGRASDYDPGEDNIVRVTARQLRTKLKEYASEEGQSDRWLLDIPKGGYVPVFERKADPAPVVSAPPPEAPVVRQRKPFWMTLLALLALVSLSVNLWLLLRSGSAAVPPQNLVSRLFEKHAGVLPVIVSDSGLVLMQHLAGRQFTVDEYSQRSYRSYPQQSVTGGDDRMRRFWDMLASRQLVNVGDVSTASRIALSLGGRAELRNARNARARDFKTGNSVILGSWSSNPWSRLFEENMNFWFRHDPGEPAAIVNRKPQNGELSEYRNGVEDRATGNSFARIALAPNLANTGRVLVIAGLTMEATEAAGEFVLDPARLAEFSPVEGAASGFEMLLQTSDVDGTGRRAKMLAYRIH